MQARPSMRDLLGDPTLAKIVARMNSDPGAPQSHPYGRMRVQQVDFA